MAKHDGVAKTGKVTRKPLHESLRSYADAKAAKAAKRLAGRMSRAAYQQAVKDAADARRKA